jgi:hypothetical protein
MPTDIKSSRLIFYIFVIILLSLIISAFVGLQLFQDGSSYLCELQGSHSAIRHHRLSVFLIQGPTILTYKLLTKLQADPNYNLQVSKLIFNVSYSLVPFISLVLSWLVIRRKNEGLLIWTALIILFINLVNFSWVSELLISLQFSCSLLLASILIPGTKSFWILMIILMPVIFLLHPLVFLIFVAIAIASAYVGYQNVKIRKAAWLSAIIFLGTAMLRGILNLYIMSPYETSFLKSSEMNNYLFVSSLENKLFLIISLAIGLICLLAKSILNLKKNAVIIFLFIISIQVAVFVLFVSNLNFLSAFDKFVILIGGVGFITGYQYRYYLRHALSDKLELFYMAGVILAAIAGCLLLSQYFSGSGKFPLKTGLTLFASMLIMLMAAVDSLREISHFESIQRFRLVTALSIIFSFVIISKSLIWQSSIQKLEQSLLMTGNSCIEVVAEDFPWLERNPYNIINNWSLPSLALIMQDSPPRKLLLEKNGCKVYYESGMVQIDPWTNLPEHLIVPPLN